MKPTIWAGSEASYETYKAFEEKFAMDKLAYANSPFDRTDNAVDLDPVFGVDADRKGLSVLQMVGDRPVIKVHGSLVQAFHRFHVWFPGQVTSYEAINDALAIVQETGAKDLTMDFASGGGQVRGLDTVTKMMKRLQKGGVTIHGHSDSSSMSASYWMQSGADLVTGSRMAEFGSIGVIAVMKTLVDTEKNMGVKFTVFKEGDFKGVGNPYEAISERDRDYIQADMKKANSFFLTHVSAQRGTDLSDTHAWAEGKSFYAEDAAKNGLIDRVADLDDLIGSGASAQTPGDKRIFGMKISAEKLAQIESGAKAEDVLTPAELKQYQANVQAAADAQKIEDDKALEAAAAQKVLDDAQLEVDKQAAATTADKPVTGAGAITAEYREALLANGRMEAKMEVLAAAVVRADAELKAAREETSNLLVVAKHAVSKLQRAVGQPQKEFTSATEILAEFNSLNTKMAAMFPTSRQSVDVPAVEVEANAEGMDNYRLKSLQLKNVTR